MMCPVCNEAMLAYEWEGIEIDGCALCGGVWLDAGEVEIIAELAGVDRGAVSEPLAHAKGPAHARRRCPRCREMLRTVTVGAGHGVGLDSCPEQHGLWFDRGEVQAYAGDRAVMIGQVLTTKTSTPDWTLLEADISYEPYAFALPRGDPALRLAVDRALAALYRSRQIEDVYARWFGRFGPPQPLLKAMYILNQIPE